MKILFTADVHIKLGQKNVPVEWAKQRYNKLWNNLQQCQELCDIFIVGGDVFDKLPNMEELECYFDFVASCQVSTLIYSGNHEAVKKDTTFLSNLKQVTNRINPKVEIIDDYYSDPRGFDIIPYNRLKSWSQNPDNEFISLHNRVLCTHVRGEIPPHVKPEVDLELFNKWNLVLAGDLHSYENCQKNILYPGSPVTTSFHRNLVETGVILLDASTLEHRWIKLDMPQLIRKTVGVDDPKPPTPYHHTIYEVEGDMQELGELEDSELIANKILKRETDTALILDNDMSLSEEVAEYLRFILNLPEPTIELALKELQNYADKIEQV